jgi:acyl-CoA thioesterase I
VKIVALGDSITEGYPYTAQESWVEYVNRKLQIKIVNQGICGNFTKDMLVRFRRDVLLLKPTHVIILGGTNDAAAGYTLGHVSDNFKAMVEISKENKIIPILGSPIPSLILEEESILKEYRNWLYVYANREKIKIIDFNHSFRSAIEEGQISKLYVDEVHPGIYGYKLMGKTAIENLKDFIN